MLLTTETASNRRLNRLSPLVDDVIANGRDEIDFDACLRVLHSRWRIQRLLCEGGGELNEALFRQGLVDEIYLTLAPIVFGGRAAPTLADGLGALRLADAAQLKLKKLRQVGAELFLVYRVQGTAGKLGCRR